jgi:hypothetical protein
MSGIAYFRCETIGELRNITQAARRTQRWAVSTSFSRAAARQCDSVHGINCTQLHEPAPDYSCASVGEGCALRLCVLRFCSIFVFGQNSPSLPEPKAEPSAGSSDEKPTNNGFDHVVGAHRRQAGAVEILSDTRGVDFGP